MKTKKSKVGKTGTAAILARSAKSLRSKNPKQGISVPVTEMKKDKKRKEMRVGRIWNLLIGVICIGFFIKRWKPEKGCEHGRYYKNQNKSFN